MKVLVADQAAPVGLEDLLPRVLDLAIEAAALVDEPVSISEVGSGGEGPWDVVIWDAALVPELGKLGSYLIVEPVASNSEPVPARWESIGPGDERARLTFGTGFERRAVALIAAWLTRQAPRQQITVEQRNMLEVIVREVRNIIDDRLAAMNPDEVAQTRAAVDTIETQLRAPKPSKRVASWALSQLPGFVLGMLTNTASSYLSLLLPGLH